MGRKHIIGAGLVAALSFVWSAGMAYADPAPLLPDAVVEALAGELSGEEAKRNLEYLAQQHRMRGSRDFHRAAGFIENRLKDYGLEQVEILRFPADGKTMHGTQKARPAWDAEFAELWEMNETDSGWRPAIRLASWDAMPITLAEDSESAEVTADLVDVGQGTSEDDYAGKDVRGKLVLVSAQPGPVTALAIERFGAAGIISYAQNQKTAWWRDDDSLVRWGHLESFGETKTFAFMISLKQARAFQERIGRGETIRLKASVRAGKHVGFYEIVTAAIAGADDKLKDQDIAFSCHLDHQRPGANDNASGCATILEVARVYAKLIAEGKLERPARTLRFYWPAEIEGTMALLTARPDLARRIKAVVHMDMVGGAPVTKAIFRVSRTPASLPSFVGDVGEAFGQFVNDQSEDYASGGDPKYPLAAPEGGKEALGAILGRFSLGSDHQIHGDSSFATPYIYLHEWPDRYIHTNKDSAANIDATKLRRAGFIGAASAYYLANFESGDLPRLWRHLQRQSLRRTAAMLERRAMLEPGEAANLTRQHWITERAVVASIGRFVAVPETLRREAAEFFGNLERTVGGGATAAATDGGGEIFERNAAIKGPMRVFGYSYFSDHLGADKAGAMRLLAYRGLWGGGGDYGYEALNLVDGKRSATDIRDALSAEFGPVPMDVVMEYLRALESIDVIRAKK